MVYFKECLITWGSSPQMIDSKLSRNHCWGLNYDQDLAVHIWFEQLTFGKHKSLVQLGERWNALPSS